MTETLYFDIADDSIIRAQPHKTFFYLEDGSYTNINRGSKFYDVSAHHFGGKRILVIKPKNVTFLCPITHKPICPDGYVVFDYIGAIISELNVEANNFPGWKSCRNHVIYAQIVNSEEDEYHEDVNIYICPKIIDYRETELKKLLTFRDVSGLSEEIVCNIFTQYLGMYHNFRE